MQLTPLNSRRAEFDAWLQQGREVLASTLSARRPADGVPTARLILQAKPVIVPFVSVMIVVFNIVGPLYLFLFRPFTWPDGSTARFMW